MNTTRSILLVLAVTLAGLAGCAAPKPKEQPQTSVPAEMLKEDWSVQEVPVAHIIRRDYRIREGDSLEIIYHVRHRENASYKIQIEDIILVRFPFQPALNQVEQVQSDGKLYLDLVGKFDVFGKTISQVQKELEAEYAKYIKAPQLTVSFQESNKKIHELKQAIQTAPRGQSRLVPVTPDGTISLPFISDIRAAGYTIGELYKLINKAYSDIGLDELEVTVNVQNVAPLRLYVLGEVRIPGPLLDRTGLLAANNEITLLQAIAQAGSYVPGRADLSKVMLVRRRNLPRPQIAIINVHQLLENRTRSAGQPVMADDSKYRYDIWLEDGDMVYVPTTEVAQRADYIEYVWTRGIRAVGGFSSSANYNADDVVDWIGPNH